MAKPKRKTPTKKSPSPKAKPTGIDEKTLTKGQIRKLTALRKSLGATIADKAFADWLKTAAGSPSQPTDKNAELIAETLGALVNTGKLSIPRGGYHITRGRKRVIVALSGISVGN